MAFASLVAAAAALPSGRAHRLGSGSLSLAALRGRGAFALPCRRDGAGRGGVLAVARGKEAAALGRDVKTACSKGSADPSSMPDEDKRFERMYRIRSKQFDDMLGLYIPLPYPLSSDEKAVQEKLKDIAEKCIALIHDAMRRLPHAERVRLDDVFWQAHHAFATVRSRATNGRANMEMAVVIAEKLYIVLTMVSSACSKPLPLDIKEAKTMVIPFDFPVFPLEDGIEEILFSMVDNIYRTVQRDVDAMITGAARD